MQSATRITRLVKCTTAILSTLVCFSATAQLNSPYSRFGLGEINNSRNVVSRGMGGLSAAYSDYQTVNLVNPASLPSLQTVTFDVGIEAAFQTLLNRERTENKKSGNLIFNYVAIGVPLLKDKKGFNRWGLTFGLKPFSQVNYNVYEEKQLPGIDSVRTFYTGTGGTYKAFVGTGFRIGNFSAGINTSYFFGQQDINNRQTWVTDSVYYFDGNFRTRTNYKQFLLDGGVQYKQKLAKNMFLRLGISGNLEQNVNLEQDIRRETYVINSNTGIDSIDVVENRSGVQGKMTMPSMFNAGIILEKENSWLVGAEYERANWDAYTVNGVAQGLATSTVFRTGLQYTPSITDNKRYFRRVTYRTGFYTGKDYIVNNGVQLPVWGVSAGFGLPIRRYNVYSNQYTALNLSLQYGSRGNKESSLQENTFRVSLGFALSDVWFIKRRYN